MSSCLGLPAPSLGQRRIRWSATAYGAARGFPDRRLGLCVSETDQLRGHPIDSFLTEPLSPGT